MTRMASPPPPSSSGDGSRPRMPSPAGWRHGRDDPAFERNIYSQLAGRLGQEIVAGLYPAGSLLPNAQEMCARFSVSRTALREAYSILSAKGLIVARPKIGTRVRPKAEWNLLDPEVLAWHLAATPSEHLVDELFALGRWSNRRPRRWRRPRRLRDTVAADRRSLRPDGAVQERRGRPDRRRPRLSHGDSRGVRKPVPGCARRPHPHRARMHVPAELARRGGHPG